MTTAETEFRCLHCDATPSTREITDGWCDACGKRLPDSYAAKAKSAAAPPKKQPDPPTRTRLVGCFPALLALVGAAAVVGVLAAL